MGEAILVAFITGGMALLGTIITIIATNRKTQEAMKTSQAIMNYKIEQLREEVKKHNDFASRMPVVEEKIKVINHRIEDLEEAKKQ